MAGGTIWGDGGLWGGGGIWGQTSPFSPQSTASPGPNPVVGASRSPWAFSLGGIALTTFEVPEEFTVGHDVAVKEHKYITETGQANIKTHVQGAFPTPTKWTGVFTTASALNRAESIDALCQATAPIPWVYGPTTRQVVIKSFHYTVKWQYEVHYEIELTIVDNGSASMPALAPLSVAQLSQQFYDYANSAYTDLQVSDINLPTDLQQAVDAANELFAELYPLSGQTYSSLSGLLSSAQTAIASIASYVTTKQDTAITEGDLDSLNFALQLQSGYGLLVENLQQLMGTAGGNNVVAPSQTNLFSIASQYYPQYDPVETAQALATANGLVDFFVEAGTPLVLPQILNITAQAA